MNTWLWPDRKISKTESRTLRDEHNAAVNLNVELLEALRFLVDAADTEPGMSIYKAHIEQARETIRKAAGRPAKEKGV